MPYIEKNRRPLIDNGVVSPECAGDMNYLLTKLYKYKDIDSIRHGVRTIIAEYIMNKGLKYQHLNDIVGAVICSSFEYYRRGLRDNTTDTGRLLEIAEILDHELEYFYMQVAGPYEDTKIEENGDV